MYVNFHSRVVGRSENQGGGQVSGIPRSFEGEGFVSIPSKYDGRLSPVSLGSDGFADPKK